MHGALRLYFAPNHDDFISLTSKQVHCRFKRPQFGGKFEKTACRKGTNFDINTDFFTRLTNKLTNSMKHSPSCEANS